MTPRCYDCGSHHGRRYVRRGVSRCRKCTFKWESKYSPYPGRRKAAQEQLRSYRSSERAVREDLP